MTKLTCRLMTVLLVLITSACTTAKLPAVTYYTINVPQKTDSAAHSKKSKAVLKIAVPRSTAAIMSRNILYQGNGYSLNAYAFSKWSDTPNRMLANLFHGMIQDAAMFRAVLPSDSSGHSDYILESSIQQFHQHLAQDGSSTARIHIGFYLIKSRSSEVIATREFVSTYKAVSTDAKGGVSALNHGSAGISSRLVTWLASLTLD